jgi:hypothetical protein
MRRLAMLVGVGTILVVTTAPAALAAASIRVSPSTNLVNGQSVVVQGGGFAADDKIVLHECVRVPGAALLCDYRKVGSSDTNGRLSGAVMKVFNSVKGTKCTAANPCFVRAKDTHGHVARATVSFGQY